MTRLIRLIALILAVGLSTAPAFAQEAAPPAEGESSGAGPLPGYITTGCLAAAAMFVLCKSARR